jgi:sodium/bile acid cotransporter 7
MLSFLVRRWFLLLLLGGVSLALAQPDLIGSITRALSPRLSIALALFLMAWTMPSRRLARELAQPWAALWAVAITYGAVPLLAWLAGLLLPSHDFRIGLLIIACVPCTLASAVLWTRMVGGSEPTALLVTLLTTATSWLVAPSWLALTTGREIAPEAFFAPMMADLLLTVVLPVAVGQLCRFFPPLAQAADRSKTVLGMVSQAFILAIIFKTTAQLGDQLQQGSVSIEAAALAGIFLTCAVLHLTALFGGLATGRWLRLDRPRRLAVAFAGSQKTLPVSLVLFGYFQREFPLAMVPLLVYHVGQLVLDTLVADIFLQPVNAAADEPAQEGI